ncbi:MAG: TrbG/VirB9 family P-type conjugative transfer protein [Hydrogenophaga sp.]|nr:TrbG/VirB9 family P-type conjugative transfer protein [Hydrogenophaga sp.]
MNALRITVLFGLGLVGPVLGSWSAGKALATEPRPDPRLREVVYDPSAVVTIPVKRGVLALLVLDADEAITDVATGLGADCSKPDAVWCVAAQPGGRHVFVKAKREASAPNNLAVVTNRRSHSFRLVVLADDDRQAPVHRLTVKAPVRAAPSSPSPLAQGLAALAALPALPAPPRPEQLVAERLQARPAVLNTSYSMAEGAASSDIVPSLVFDDGRFTYLRIAGQRELPAVFKVQADGSESLVNTRMEDDLMVVDRVSLRLVLRAGRAVVGIWNDAFDPDGVATAGATTVPGIQRVIKADPSPRAERNLGGVP